MAASSTSIAAHNPKGQLMICIPAVLALILFSTPSLAEVIVTEQIDHFTASGRNKREISNSIAANSPMRGKKSFALATTQSDFRYEYSFSKSGGRCNVDTVTIYLDLVYTYPRLTNKVSKRTEAWWKRQQAVLEKHELTHGEISKHFARRLERVILAMDDLNCSTMREEILRRARYYSRAMEKEHDEFDRRERRSH